MAELTHTRHERDGANGAGKSPDPAHDVATQPQAAQLMFDNTYARELEGFYVRWMPAASPAPRLLKVNPDLALELGLDLAELNSPAGLDILAGNVVPRGTSLWRKPTRGTSLEVSPRGWVTDGRCCWVR